MRMASAPPGPSPSAYTPDTSVMKPIRIMPSETPSARAPAAAKDSTAPDRKSIRLNSSHYSFLSRTSLVLVFSIVQVVRQSRQHIGLVLAVVNQQFDFVTCDLTPGVRDRHADGLGPARAVAIGIHPRHVGDETNSNNAIRDPVGQGPGRGERQYGACNQLRDFGQEISRILTPRRAPRDRCGARVHNIQMIVRGVRIRVSMLTGPRCIAPGPFTYAA